MSNEIREAVQAKYGALAASGLSSDHAGVHAVAQAFGYSPEELAAIPAEANMGVSCGNPTAQASLRDGETVVDLGCGGGLDVFLAARRVGPGGKAIGIDMTPEMIELARRNAAKAGVTNVEFHLATIDQLPLPDAAGGLRHQQLRDQSGSRQARGVPRDRAGAEAGRTRGGQRYCLETTTPGGLAIRYLGLRRLHRRRHPDRRLPARACSTPDSRTSR